MERGAGRQETSGSFETEETQRRAWSGSRLLEDVVLDVVYRGRKTRRRASAVEVRPVECLMIGEMSSQGKVGGEFISRPAIK